ncbi:MAG: ABC transporter permease [Marinibacterium sp.]
MTATDPASASLLPAPPPHGAQDSGYVPPPPVPATPPPSTNRRFTTWRSIAALMLREMTSSYGRTPGGYIWEILEPALGVALLVMIFKTGLRTPPLGTNFAMFYATGILSFQMWSKLSSNVAAAVRYSRPFLGYPAVTFLDALIARFLLAVLTQAIVSFLLIASIRSIYDTQTIVDFGTILLGYAMTIAFALGVGLMNAFLFEMYPLYKNIWNITTRPLLFISGVIILYDVIPDPYRSWLWWNPLVHCIGVIRSGFYIHYDAAYASPIYVFIVTGVTGAAGLLFVSRYYRDLLDI